MDFLNFLKEYYYIIILVLSVVILGIELLLSFKVKPNQNVLNFIDKIVPNLIIDAEKKYGEGHGDDKLLYVFRAVAGSLLDVFNIQAFDKYEKYTKNAIETILKTPQKKEGD